MNVDRCILLHLCVFIGGWNQLIDIGINDAI